MIFEESEFIFRAPSAIARARRVLIKPCASYPLLYPVSTSRDMLATLIHGIRRVSDADIIILEGTLDGSPIYPVYKALGYDFPRVLMLDVKDCILVEVDNPLPKPLAIPTFWVPNVILSSDYLITVAPLKVNRGRGNFSIMNMLSLLPTSKYNGDGPNRREALYSMGIDKVVADLYFTLPFDLGIIEGRQKLVTYGGPSEGEVEDYNKVFIGEPYEVDSEATEALGVRTDYIELIREAKVGFEA